MCRQEGLLSPLYEYSHRGGCWFCPNASMTELRHLYRAHPDLWQLMLELQDTPNKATERFNRNFTFAELDLRFRLEGEQLSFYDKAGDKSNADQKNCPVHGCMRVFPVTAQRPAQATMPAAGRQRRLHGSRRQHRL